MFKTEALKHVLVRLDKQYKEIKLQPTRNIHFRVWKQVEEESY